MGDQRISVDELRPFAVASLEASGISADDARLGADVLIWASLRGVDTHGIRNLKAYYVDSAGGVGRRDGVIKPTATLERLQETDTTLALDANGGLGLAVGVKAMRRAIDKATEHGVGVVTVRNSTHFGAAGYYAHMATEHDMIGFASTGYLFPLGQPKAVVPFGGLVPMLSTNPLAMACPCESFPPFLLDMSTSLVPVNRIEMLEELGKAIPPGWALNDEHQAAVVPQDARKVEPLGGATSYGGHKGYGLGLAIWILTGLMSGAWRTEPKMDRVLGDRVGTSHNHAQEGIGHCFAAIRLDCFQDVQSFKRGLDAVVRTITESAPAEGHEQVKIPGQLEYETELHRRQHGIPLPESTVRSLSSLAKEFDIPLHFM